MDDQGEPFLLMFDLLPDPHWLFDPLTLRLIAVNQAACAYLQRSAETLLAATVADLLPDEDRPTMRSVAAAIPSDRSSTDVWRLRRGDGVLLYVEIRWRKAEHLGRPAVVASLSDADDRQGLEKSMAVDNRLIEKRARLQLVQRLLKVTFWKLDIQAGAMIWDEDGFALPDLNHNRTPPDLDAFVALVDPQDRGGLRAEIQRLLTGQAQSISFQHRLAHADDRHVHLRGVIERVVTAEGVEQLFGIVQDVTEEVAAADKLDEANMLVRLASKAAGLGAWRVTLNPERTVWSDKTAEIHGRPPGYSPSVEEGIADYAPEYRARISSAFADCVAQGAPFDEILQIVTMQGARVWVRAVGEAARDASGVIVAVQGALQDIDDVMTSRAEAETLSAQLRDSLQSMSDAFFSIDRQGRFLFANAQAEQLLQRSSASLVGAHVWDEFPGAVGLAFQTEYDAAFRLQETRRFTAHFPPLGKWFEVRAFPRPDTLAVYFRDITADRARSEQLRLLESALSRINDIVLITEAAPLDAPDGPRMVYVNDAFERITGFDRAAALGRTPRMLQGEKTSRDELDRIHLALQRFEPVKAELINYTKSGEPYWLEIDIVPIVSETGSPSHFVAVERNITERKRQEAALQISNERFHLISRATHDAIWDWDIGQDIVWWSEALRNFFGVSAPDVAEDGLQGKLTCIHPEDRPRVAASLDRLLGRSDTHWSEEYRFICGDDRTMTVVDRGVVLRDADGAAIRMLGSISDVTDQRELEHRYRQSQKLEAVGHLTGGVAHDFNNLLTVILGATEMLSRQLADDPRFRHLAQMTETAARRGAELTTRLLAFGRRQALEPKPTDANRLLAEMLELLTRTLSEDIDIRLVPQDDLWITDIDPGQLENCVLNLAINARDAMPNGGCITIETGNVFLDEQYAARDSDIRAGPYVLITVSDTGVGMDLETLEQAFEPFFTTKEVGYGSGLGLSMVYGFVKQSQGHVRIYSERDEGTTVKIYLRRAGAGRDDARPSPRDAGPLQRGHEKILLVEDDELVRMYVTEQLVDLGYTVVAQPHGPAALEVLEQTGDFDLLFTDVVMPGGMNGRELAEAAKRLHPRLAILFTSGYPVNAMVHNGRLVEGMQMLAKPYIRADLARKIREVLDARPDPAACSSR